MEESATFFKSSPAGGAFLATGAENPYNQPASTFLRPRSPGKSALEQGVTESRCWTGTCWF